MNTAAFGIAPIRATVRATGRHFPLWVALALMVAAAPRAPAQVPPSELRSIDVYRTAQLDVDALVRRHEPAIRELVAAFGGGADGEAIDRVYSGIVESVRASGDFALVELAATTSFEQDVNAVYVTIEVVDRADAPLRLAFDPEPTGTVADPDGVLAAWDAYQTAGFELLQTRQIEPLAASCPVHHCFVGFEHEALAPFLARFDRAAREHRAELVEVLRQDADPRKRANAAFVLAHAEDARQLVRDLEPSLDDPAAGVRNNVMRVLLMIAENDATIEIPFAPLARRIDDPSSSCRNKAASLIAVLAERPEYRDDILAIVPAVLRLLRLEKPNNHDPAYAILTTLSRADFGARDYARWEAWIDEQQARTRP